MSHLGVRIVADQLADPDEGVTAIAGVLPRDGDDAAPTLAAVYDQTRHPWVGRFVVPDPDAEGLEFPCLVVWLIGATFESGFPTEGSGGPYAEGQLTVGVQLVLRDVDTEQAFTDALYLEKAVRDSLLLLNQPSRLTKRRRAFVQLEAATEIVAGSSDAPIADTVVALALQLTYPVTELTLVPPIVSIAA